MASPPAAEIEKLAPSIGSVGNDDEIRDEIEAQRLKHVLRKRKVCWYLLAALGLFMLVAFKTSNQPTGIHICQFPKRPSSAISPGVIEQPQHYSLTQPAMPNAQPATAYTTQHSIDLPLSTHTPSSFAFHDRTHSNRNKVHGNITVAQTNSSQEHPLRLEATVSSEDSELSNAIYFRLVKDNEDSSNDVVEMGLTNGNQHGRWRSVEVNITLWVKTQAEFRDFQVITNNLNIEIGKSLSVLNTPSASFKTNTGVINAEYFESPTSYPRRVFLDTNSNRITGTYPLADLLSIHSNSGSVDIAVSPKEGLNLDQITEAKLLAKSNSASLAIRYIYSEGQIPERNFKADVTTNSGSIRIPRVLHSSESSFNSNSGSLDIVCVPFMHTSGTLETTAHSSQTHFTIEPLVGMEGKPLRDLQSNHVGHSGSLNLVYPREWEGDINCEIFSGDCKVVGEDVHITRNERTITGGRTILGYKGPKDSSNAGSVSILGHSGSAGLRFG